MTVSPLVESRGLHKGFLIVRRTGSQELSIPLQIDIVDLGKGPSCILAAPAKIHLQGKPGDVQQFEVRTKLAVEAGLATEELSAVAGNFKDSSGKAIDLDVEFRWNGGAKLTRSNPATVQGFLVVPDRHGSFTATMTISSVNSGSIQIPLTLEIK